MTIKRIPYRRYGRFSLDVCVICEEIEVAHAIMREVVVLKCECDTDTGVFMYFGISKQFDQMEKPITEACDDIPIYDWIITRDSAGNFKARARKQQ